MYLAFFIHIGRYDIKARRYLACVQNGITQLGDWRMETWQLALRARCHVSIRQSPSLCNAILNTCPCLLAILPNVWRCLFAIRSHILNFRIHQLYTWARFLSHILSQVSWQVTWPRLRPQVTCGAFCLSFLKWLHKSLGPKSLGLFWNAPYCFPSDALLT